METATAVTVVMVVMVVVAAIDVVIEDGSEHQGRLDSGR